MLQVVNRVPEGEQCALPPPTQMSTMMGNKEDQINADITQDKFQLNPNDSDNFLKLCAAIHILLCHHFMDSDIDHAE